MIKEWKSCGAIPDARDCTVLDDDAYVGPVELLNSHHVVVFEHPFVARVDFRRDEVLSALVQHPHERTVELRLSRGTMVVLFITNNLGVSKYLMLSVDAGVFGSAFSEKRTPASVCRK
jgi:hypothetical protein